MSETMDPEEVSIPLDELPAYLEAQMAETAGLRAQLAARDALIAGVREALIEFQAAAVLWLAKGSDPQSTLEQFGPALDRLIAADVSIRAALAATPEPALEAVRREGAEAMRERIAARVERLVFADWRPSELAASIRALPAERAEGGAE